MKSDLLSVGGVVGSLRLLTILNLGPVVLDPAVDSVARRLGEDDKRFYKER